MTKQRSAYLRNLLDPVAGHPGATEVQLFKAGRRVQKASEDIVGNVACPVLCAGGHDSLARTDLCHHEAREPRAGGCATCLLWSTPCWHRCVSRLPSVQAAKAVDMETLFATETRAGVRDAEDGCQATPRSVARIPVDYR